MLRSLIQTINLLRGDRGLDRPGRAIPGRTFIHLRGESLEDRRMLSIDMLGVGSQYDNIAFITGDDLPPVPSVYTADIDETAGKMAQVSEIAVGTELIVNGGFETGDFIGWTVNAPINPLAPWTVSAAGGGSGMPAPTSPPEGLYDAWNGFDGDGPIEFTMYQDVSIPGTTIATLRWQDRAQWNVDGQPRTLEVQVRDPATDAVLGTVYSFSTTGTSGDTDWQSHNVDLSSYAGSDVRIYFVEDIPESFTGPGQIEFDGISLSVQTGGGGAGRLFAVPMDNSNQIVELDPATGAEISRFAAPETVSMGPDGLAYDGSSLFFLNGFGSDTLWELDPDTGVPLDSDLVTVGSGYYDGLAALGGQVYILDFGLSDILEFDPVTDAVPRVLDVDALNGVTIGGGLAGITDPNALLAFNCLNNNVVEISPVTGMITDTFYPGPGFSPALAVVDGEIYTVDGSGTVNVFDRAGTFLRNTTAPLPYAVSALAGNDVPSTNQAGILIDHNDTNITALSEAAINKAKTDLHIAYGHTSHGSQLIDGMTGLVAFANGGGKGLSLPGDIFAWNDGGIGGALDLHDYAMAGDVGYYPQWVDNTVGYLNDPSNSDVNVIIWSWCGQVGGKYAAGTLQSEYLAPMNTLEQQYPDVTFVYMTGHVDHWDDANNKAANQMIRDYCIANEKVLYDFADIESYDPDGVYYEFPSDNCDYYESANGPFLGNWADNWVYAPTHVENVDWYDCPSEHSRPLNANQKAYAAWALWTEIAAIRDTGSQPEVDLLYLGMYDAGYEFDTYDLDTRVLTLVKKPSYGFGWLETSPDGILYGGNGADVYTVDRTTGDATHVAPFTHVGTPIACDGLTFKPDGSMYFLDGQDSLYSANATTGELTLIGAITGLTGLLNAIEYADGSLYGSGDQRLYTIDTSTGATTLRGNPATAMGPWDMDYGADGVMRATGGYQLYEISLIDGSATLIDTFTKACGGIASKASEASGPQDPTPPTAVELVASSDTGVSNTDNITNLDNSTSGKTLEFSVSGTISGATVTVYSDGAGIGSATASGTTTTVTTNGTYDIVDGGHTITARQTEPGKSESGDSSELDVTVDTQAPSTPGAPDLQAASDSGVSSTDNITNDNTPGFTISASPYFRFYRNGLLISGQYGSGNSYTATTQSDGTYDYTVAVIDAAGNTSPQSASLSVTIDTVALSFTSGSLDPLFGSGGKLATTFSQMINGTRDLAVQSDGKIVVVGNDGSGGPALLARFNSDGLLDNTFAGNGKLISTIDVEYLGARAVAVQADGRIVVGGYVSNGSNNDFVLARLTSSGALDTTFGGGTGKVITPVGDDDDVLSDLTIQPDGKILAAGYARVGGIIRATVVRYNADDGTLDGTFGEGGKSILPQSSSLVSDLLIQPDGYILAATGSILRLSPNGEIDPLFGDNGVASNLIGGVSCRFGKVSLQSDGKILAAGSGPSGGDQYIAVVRYEPDGSLDLSFGGIGGVTTSFSTRWASARDLVVLDNGKILVAGDVDPGSNSDFVLLRYNADGSLDPSFNGDGTVRTDFNSSGGYRHDYVTGMVLQSDRVILVGKCPEPISGNYYRIAMVRYVLDGLALDLQPASDTGVNSTDNITNDNTPTFDLPTIPYFRFYRDGIQISGDYEIGATYTTAAQPHGTFDYTVTAVDAAGNESAQSAGLTVQIDTAAPTVTSRTPAPGSTVSTQAFDVDVTFSETVQNVDASDLVRSGDAGGTVGTPTHQGGNTWRFPVTGLDKGTLNVSLAPDIDDILDTAGNDLANLLWSYSVDLPAAVVGRHVFYNNSAWDGDNSAATAADDSAVALDKQALLPGQTATFANYTSYSKGINGVMVDIDGPVATATAADFQFKVGNDTAFAGWATAPAPQSITVRAGAGVGGSDRVTVIWADNDWHTTTPETGAIARQWLQVTVLATANTGLAADDVFYFGNAVGESGNTPLNAAIDATDEIGARNNPHWFLDPAPLDDAYDYNRDQKVDATDQIIARNNQTFFLNDLDLIAVPVPPAAGGSVSSATAQVATPVALLGSRSQDFNVLLEMLSDGRAFLPSVRQDTANRQVAVPTTPAAAYDAVLEEGLTAEPETLTVAPFEAFWLYDFELTQESKQDDSSKKAVDQLFADDLLYLLLP